jgi:hypothetical protein
MDANAYVGEVIAAFVYFFVGVRLYLLSRRTRQLPEILIAVSFLLWTLSYAIWDIPYAFVDSEELVPAVYSYGSLVALASGTIVFTFFIRAVFRPAARWAIGLVAAIAATNLAGVVGMAYMGDWEGVNPLANPWYWLEFFGGVAPSAWMGAEGLTKYFKTRRQLKLGLCDPMTCNRFLLWGIAGSLWVALEGVVTASDLVYAFTGQWSELLGLGMALFDVAPITIFWFVFFPPEFYCRWIEGSGSSGAEEGSPSN